jgi:hypothetical protein
MPRFEMVMSVTRSGADAIDAAHRLQMAVPDLRPTNEPLEKYARFIGNRISLYAMHGDLRLARFKAILCILQQNHNLSAALVSR